MLRKRIAELQDYRRLGILTASDASRYEKMKVERVSSLVALSGYWFLKFCNRSLVIAPRSAIRLASHQRWLNGL